MTVQQKQKKPMTMIESLEGRRLCSASTGFDADASLSAADAGKVSMQDFHFVMKVNKPSPGLTATGAGAGKVSMQDLNFVATVSKASPKIFL